MGGVNAQPTLFADAWMAREVERKQTEDAVSRLARIIASGDRKKAAKPARRQQSFGFAERVKRAGSAVARNERRAAKKAKHEARLEVLRKADNDATVVILVHAAYRDGTPNEPDYLGRVLVTITGWQVSKGPRYEVADVGQWAGFMGRMGRRVEVRREAR